MIGNDIIDLKAVPERSPLHWKRYRNKTMTTSEQELLAPYQENNLDIWLAWSVKESVYKLEFQLEQQRYFAPKVIQVLTFDSNLFTGKAQGKLGTYSFEIQLQQSFLHTLAWSDERSKPAFHCLALDILPLHRHLAQALQQRFPKQQLVYERWPFPRFISACKKIIPISMSHDGAWGAYAYCDS